jgi:hypothetical protein
LDSELDDGEAWAFNAHGSMAEAATNERRVRDMPKMLLQGSANPQLVPIHSYGALGRGLLSAGRCRNYHSSFNPGDAKVSGKVQQINRTDGSGDFNEINLILARVKDGEISNGIVF